MQDNLMSVINKILKYKFKIQSDNSFNVIHYRSGTVNSKFHLIWSFFEIFARFLLFHV